MLEAGEPRDRTAAGVSAAAGPLAEDDGMALLDPARLSLRRGPTGVLRATVAGPAGLSYLQLAVYRAFPLSEPGRWVTLLDGEGREIGTIADPAALDAESGRLLAEECDLRYLTPHVVEVVEVREDTTEGGGWSPTLIWVLETDRGPLRLRLPNLVDHVRALGTHRYLIQDREGRRAEIVDATALPAASRAWLRRYLWL